MNTAVDEYVFVEDDDFGVTLMPESDECEKEEPLSGTKQPAPKLSAISMFKSANQKTWEDRNPSVAARAYDSGGKLLEIRKIAANKGQLGYWDQQMNKLVYAHKNKNNDGNYNAGTQVLVTQPPVEPARHIMS